MDRPLDSNSDSVPYQPLFNNDQRSFGDNERDCLMGVEEHEMPPVENFVTTPRKEARWTHISDLDDFFTRVYEYYQRHGFLCMVLEDMLQVIFLWYVVSFSLFIGVAVDYKVLFQEGYNHSIKVTISDAILPWSEVQHSFNSPLIILLVVTTLYLLFRSQKALFNVTKYWEMRMFFRDGLRIKPRELPDKTWRDVQSRLIELQSRIQMCLHKNDINELDVCHRILRFKNYMIGMVNKLVLPMKYQVPFMGESTFFTSGLKYNFEMILFWGPGAPFKNSWQLKSNYKQFAKKEEAAAELSKRIFLFGLVNFITIPFICIWTVLYFFFENFALFRNDPSLLGSRTWSLYGRCYLRHYNELNHDFHTRLNKGYRASVKYMGLFWSPFLAIISKFVMSICSGFLVFLLACTVADEDTLAVKGMIGILTVLGIVVTIAKTLVPDENMVKMPESLMNNILCHVHYVPDNWRGQAHTFRVQREFSQLFQYKIVYLINEMLSPILAPFILWFWLRPRSLMIVNFLRNNTISLNGLGDVCIFAHLDFKKTGYYNINMRNRHAQPPNDEPNTMNFKAAEEIGGNITELKKMELSLLHFTLANPDWKIPEAEIEVLSHIRENVNALKKDMGVFNPSAQDNPLYTSSQVLSMLSQTGYHSMTMSSLPKSQFRMSGISQKSESDAPQCSDANLPIGSDMNVEATTSSSSSAPDSMQTWRSQSNMPHLAMCSTATLGSHGPVNEAVVEMMANEMSYSALYFHGTYRNRKPTDLLPSSQPTADDFPGPVDGREEELNLARYFQRRNQEMFTTTETPKELLKLSNIEEEDELVRQADNKFRV